MIKGLPGRAGGTWNDHGKRGKWIRKIGGGGELATARDNFLVSRLASHVYRFHKFGSARRSRGGGVSLSGVRSYIGME